MISVKNLYKSFGSHQVLHDINEHIAPGEKIVIIGPSGSGKSTFLRCMNLLERPTSGQIIFDGIDITDPKTDINKVRQHYTCTGTSEVNEVRRSERRSS